MLFVLSFSFSAFSEPVNLETCKQNLQHYHNSGEYSDEIRQVINRASIYLQQRISENEHIKNPQKLAVVLDIDETSLSNYDVIKALNFGGTLDMIRKAIDEGHPPAILPTLKLYEVAQKHHIAVFFITGRYIDEQTVTIRALLNAGYSHWQGLLMRNMDNKQSVQEYKTSMRRKITELGYDIVENIGDQKSDLLGGYSEMQFKLPNPYYYIP